MSMSTTRSLRNRSSRYSSPATFADSQVASKPAEVQNDSNGGHTTFDKWVEPIPRNPVPSFEDTKGLERVGVLEHMQPLGVPPTQKLLQKLKVNLNRSSPRITPVNAEEATPPMDTVRMEGASPPETEPLPEPVKIEELITISSPPRGRPAKKELDEMRQAIDINTPSPVKTTFTSTQPSPRPQSIQDYIRQDRMKSVIDRAIAEANDQTNYKIVPGLQQLWEDARAKPQLWTVLDAILNKSPTDAQFRVFKKYIKRGIKRYRNGSTDQNTPYNLHQVDSPQTQPVGYLHTFPSQNTSNSFSHDPLNPQSVHSSFRFKPTSGQQSSPGLRYQMSPSLRMDPFPVERNLNSSPRRKRSRSESSTSSLSSAKSMPEDYSSQTIEMDANGQAAEERPVRSSGSRQATDRVAAGSRTRSSANPQLESSQPASGPPTSFKLVSKNSKIAHRKGDSAYDSDSIDAKRREFEADSLHNYNTIQRPQSDERTAVQGREVSENTSPTRVLPPVIHPRPLLPPSTTLLSPRGPQARPELSLLNGFSRKRPYDEIDKEDIDVITPLSSSPAPGFPPPPPPPPPAAYNSTRGVTPRAAKPLPPNTTRKSARVMISPNKPKNGGITAGISRAGPGRDVTIGNGAESGAEDNDEFCASCGGEGTLLCCDGCTNSFHHGCLEPPLNPDYDVEGEWYCPRCIARRNKDFLPTTGLLGQVIRRVYHTIPKAYSLPGDIRDYFEGVKTGDEGEYEEIGLPRTQNTGAKMNRAGFFEEPSYKELRDSKGNFIICYRCQKTSNGRDIIPCDYCPAKWHTDCVDPPLAVPPRRRGGEKPTGYWRCPLHIDGDLAEIGRQAEAAPGDLGRLPRLRKPKKAIPIDVDLSRGFKNNGVIEVEFMKDETPDIRIIPLEHSVYRIPERGIRLDFIDRVKKSWFEDQVFPQQLHAEPRIRSRLYRPDDPVLHHPAAYTVVKQREPESMKGMTAMSVAETARANVRLRQKSFKEQSAIMSLLGLSNQSKRGYSVDPLADLTNTLVAEAPEEAVQAITSSEKDSLLKLQRLVNSRLALYDTQNSLKASKLSKKATSEPVINGDMTAQLNGDGESDKDDKNEGGDEL